MKQQVDKGRTERVFEQGEWVYLKLQPYRQLSVKKRRDLKLAPRYFGPYQILKVINPVAYELDLPSTAQVHPVFHVSQLKAKIGKKVLPARDLPTVGEDGHFLPEPACILQIRNRRRGKRSFQEGLVQWIGQSPEDATWEPLKRILSEHPNLEVKVGLEEGARCYMAMEISYYRGKDREEERDEGIKVSPSHQIGAVEQYISGSDRGSCKRIQAVQRSQIQQLQIARVSPGLGSGPGCLDP